MTFDYRQGKIQRRKYILIPLLKLLAILIVGLTIGTIAFDIQIEAMPMAFGFTCAWFFFMHFLPLLVLANRHHQVSKDAYFVIDTTNNSYQYRDKDVLLSFQLTEVERVIKVVSPPKYDERIDPSGFGHFYYWKIVFANQQTLSISCMVLDASNFPGKHFFPWKELIFPGKELVKEKKMFPMPPSNRGLQYLNQSLH
jgi:hypothetical protein